MSAATTRVIVDVKNFYVCIIHRNHMQRKAVKKILMTSFKLGERDLSLLLSGKVDKAKEVRRRMLDAHSGLWI